MVVVGRLLDGFSRGEEGRDGGVLSTTDGKQQTWTDRVEVRMTMLC